MCDVHWNALLCSTTCHSIVRYVEVVLCSRFHFPQYPFLIFKERKVARNWDVLHEQGNFYFDELRWLFKKSTPVIKKTTSGILILNWHYFSCCLSTFCYLRLLPTLSFLPPSYHSIPFIYPRYSNFWTIFAPFNLSVSCSISGSFLTLPLYSFHFPFFVSFSNSPSLRTFVYWFSMLQYNVQHVLHSIFTQKRAFN
jgi:hypothetical protein